MKKKIRKNLQGTVLLTVICFTTMCMIIAAIALHVSNSADKQSNDNVMRTQAQITAEHYLEQYLSTFPVDSKTGKTNYDMIKKLAGPTEEAAGKVTITLKQGATSSVNVSKELYATEDQETLETLKSTAAFGGNCTIYIYKANANGYVVKAVADYDGQAGVSSAYFYGITPTTDLNKNAIETCGTYNVSETANVSGDILIEEVNPGSAVLKFKNNNGIYYSNIKSNGNITESTENVVIADTLQGYAPTLTAEGHIFLKQTVMYTDIGKTDINGKNAKKKNGATLVAVDGYDPDHLLNKNGYINSDKKVFFSAQTGGTSIGKSGYPIDIYCRGMVIGTIPKTAYGSVSAGKAAEFADQIYGLFGALNPGGNSVAPTLYGNVYCYKKQSGSTIDTDGNLIINVKSGGNATIHGDLVVDGNIYILDKELVVTGKVYCSGTVSGTIKNASGAAQKIITKLPTDDRSIQPSMDYAPGLYKPGQNDSPTISKPSTYPSVTSIFTDPDEEKTKGFRKNFETALKYTLDSEYTSGSTKKKVCPEYTSDGNLQNGIHKIYKSCRLTETQVKTKASFSIEVQDTDIWILLPMTDSSSAIAQECSFRVNNPSNKHHCYFVFYKWSTGTNYASDAGKKVASTFYTGLNADGTKYTGSPRYALEVDRQNNQTAVCTYDFASTFDTQTFNNIDAVTNIIYLMPDNSTISIGRFPSNYHAVFYGPKSTLINDVNKGDRVIGQIKVANYDTMGGASNKTQASRFAELEEGSLLHAFLTDASSKTGSLNFQYYIKHK